MEKADGNKEILTASDIPSKEENVSLGQGLEEATTESKTADEKQADELDDLGDMDLGEVKKEASVSWKEAFQKETPKPSPSPTTTSSSKPKEEWKSKFENVKSATATHKAKGG